MTTFTNMPTTPHPSTRKTREKSFLKIFKSHEKIQKHSSGRHETGHKGFTSFSSYRLLNEHWKTKILRRVAFDKINFQQEGEMTF